jgi:hypothetical protein
VRALGKRAAKDVMALLLDQVPRIPRGSALAKIQEVVTKHQGDAPA